jgi:hypothetical protein
VDEALLKVEMLLIVVVFESAVMPIVCEVHDLLQE